MHLSANSQFPEIETHQKLLQLWSSRYLPNLDNLPRQVKRHIVPRLHAAIEDRARHKTRQVVRQHLALACASAAAETQELLTTSGIAPCSWEIRDLSIQMHTIYEVLMECYASSCIFSPLLRYVNTVHSDFSRHLVAVEVLPAFHQLTAKLNPRLQEIKMAYRFSKTPNMGGFMTTQFHLTQQRILQPLDSYTRFWLTPYLQLVDEMLCMPWQQICTVAATRTIPHEAVSIVEKTLANSQTVAEATYGRSLKFYPQHRSYQGRIQSQAVQYSCVRDFNMFQAYICLCLLEGSLTAIERDLLPLCQQVFAATSVSWELVTRTVADILEQMQQPLTPEEKLVFTSYAREIESLFVRAAEQHGEIYSQQHLTMSAS